MAKLLSVNVGLPRDIEWKGRSVHTGTWKHPVEGRCRVRCLNLDGDGQGDLAGHGGEQRAVFVYQIGIVSQEQLKRTVSCDRVGIRMNEPRMPALLTSSGRPGFYLRVLDEGEVGATPPSADCVHFASKILEVWKAQSVWIQSFTMIEYSPEKAGFGGSTPSLATISFNSLETPQKISHL